MGTVTANRYVSAEFSWEQLDRDFYRADIVFHNVDHSEASFDARVYLNNPEADEKTGVASETGYAGTFHIFGHGGCYGDEGHCDITGRRMYDPRPAHALAPGRKVVIATDAVRRAMRAGPAVTVTVVPVVTATTPKCSGDVLKFDRLEVVTYR